jgi:8-oxo-dGTP pyrophosphatase MutT (NUDIX family)
MYCKIYFANKPLFLCDQIDDTIEPFLHHDDAIFMDELDTHSIKTMIHEMQQPKVHAGIFLHPDLEELKQAFFKKFTLIKAGGGLVKNKKEELLLIFRRGKWDLPKGKLDKGEKLLDCAIREVKEETGLKFIEAGEQITTTYHTYHEGTKFILKESHWWGMKLTVDEKAVPQLEEDITEIRWVPVRALENYLENSFVLITDIIAAAVRTGFVKT